MSTNDEDNRSRVLKRARDLLISGAIGGAGLTAGAKFFNGARSLGEIGKAALKGGAIAGPIASASGLAGGLLYGEPEEGEAGANSRRGLAGGALLGTGLGALSGGAVASGATGRAPTWLKKFLGFAAKEAPTENLAGDAIRRYASAPSLTNTLKGAGVGGAAGGALGSFVGWDEGNQLDFAENTAQRARKRRARARTLAYD